jgi:hypothetical protein
MRMFRSMIGIGALALLLGAILALYANPVRAAAGHENSCLAVNVNYGGGAMTIVCSSGSINMALLNGSSQAGTCPTVDIDDLKILTSLALAARVSGLVMTIWYTDACGAGGSQTIRAIASIEVKGN